MPTWLKVKPKWLQKVINKTMKNQEKGALGKSWGNEKTADPTRPRNGGEAKNELK